MQALRKLEEFIAHSKIDSDMNFKDGSESNEKDNQEIKEQITI
jgi:hypothetical protein